MEGTTAPVTPAPTPATAPSSNRDVVIFHVWQSLAYGPRLIVSFVLISFGLLSQAAGIVYGLPGLIAFAAGLPPLLLGNLFLLVKGYDNRVDMKSFDPTATWETVQREKLTQLKELDKKIARWDRSLMDVTSALGAILLLFVIGATFVVAALAPTPVRLLVLDLAFLAAPHWFTGTRRILRLPKLQIKIETIEQLLNSAAPLLADKQLEILMLLKGKEKRIPDDVKFRLSLKEQNPDFLGLYGQVVTNDVQGKSFPYFYVVIVAKKGYGLDTLFAGYQPPQNVIKELGGEGEVEFIVVRQFTTATSGYLTKPDTALLILTEGVNLAARVAHKQ